LLATLFTNHEMKTIKNSTLNNNDRQAIEASALVQLSVDIYKTLQSCKDYSFQNQITRAGLSIPSNVAEGFERESIKECVNFLSYAKGSTGEVRTQTYIGIEIGYINKETATNG